MKKIISFIFVFCVTMCLAQEVTITKVQQRYPWNGLVDIEFEVPSATCINLHAINLTTSTEIEMKTFLDSTGKTIEQPFQVSAGTHTITWNSDVDTPNTTKETIKIFVYEFKYTVRFNANGGEGTMSDLSFKHGVEQALSTNAFTRECYVFAGWSTRADGDVVYSNGAVVNNLTTEANGVVDLYAVWNHKSVQLWEGGPYWAETNIGAEKPEGYGYYFWWGGTIGYKRENDKWVASDGSSSNFSFEESNIPTYDQDGKGYATLQREGWITSDGVLSPEHDAARAHWGSKWRMPTESELRALCSNCTWSWTTTNGVKGYIVSGKGAYSEASIFLPAAGYGIGTSRNATGSYGYYWSSVPHSANIYNRHSWILYFLVNQHYADYNSRNVGYPVRPVSDVH